MIIFQIGSAIGYLILGLANSLPLLFLSRLIDGITGGNISIAQAYIADVTTKENRARGMGLIGAAFGLGFIFGPAIGGFLSKFSYSLPAYFAVFVSLLTVMATFLFLKETVNEKKAISSPKTAFSINEFLRVLKLNPIGILMIVFFLINFSFSVMQGIFALWTEKKFNFQASDNGWFFSYVGIVGVLVQLQVLPRLLKRFKEKEILNFGIIFLLLGLFLIPTTRKPFFLIIPLTFLPLGNGLSNPTIQSIASENVPKEEYGETLGILQTAGALGRILGPIVGGEFFQLIGSDSPFYFSSFLLLITLFYLGLQLKNP